MFRRNVTMLFVILAGFLPTNLFLQTGNRFDYLFPNIPGFRTDGPPTPPKLILEIQPPAVPDRLNVYTLETVKVDEAYVQQLAEAFGLAAEAVPVHGGKWEVLDEGDQADQRRSLTVFETSGSFSYMYDNLLFAPVDQPPQLPSQEEAYQLALQLLRGNGLLPESAVTDFEQVTFSSPTLVERDALKKQTLQEFPTGIEVRFPQVVEGFRTSGPGSKLYVAFGEAGNVLGVTRALRSVEEVAFSTPSITPSAALDLLQMGAGVMDATSPDCVSANVTGMQIVYWMESPQVQQRLSLPVYSILGDCLSAEGERLGDFQAFAPAVSSPAGFRSFIPLLLKAGEEDSRIEDRPERSASAYTTLAGCCEEGTKEIFIEHIEEYTATGNTDLPGCADTTSGLYGEFDDAGGWSKTWYADFNAWESDWKKTSLSGGADATWADARDFAYLCGHGNVGYVRFTTNMTDQYLWNTDTGFADVDLEWATFDTSKTLQRQAGAAELDTWYLNAFQGLHLLIGWHDSPLDGDTGGEFADEMIDWGFFDGGGKDITSAWFSGSGGCTDQNSGTTQMIVAEDLIHYDDFMHGQGSVAADASPNGSYWMWSHDC